MLRPRLIRSELVVLSACHTAEFRDPSTLQPGQLPVSALMAGAGEVVASLWDIDASATAEWMRVFYGSLAGGKTVTVAMRNAAEHMRRGTRWQHPRFWAGFAHYATELGDRAYFVPNPASIALKQ
jgi:CHAT domain-containing protein